MKNKFVNSLVILFALIFLGTNCNKQENIRPSMENESTSDLTASKFPKPDHIVIVVEENHSYWQIMRSDSAPFINALALDSSAVKFKQSYAITHPSQPNYLQLYSGSDQGVTNDANPTNDPFTTPNLGAQLIAAGYSFATYSMGLPRVGFNGDTSNAYVRRHNPAANWMGTGLNQIPPSTNRPFSTFPTDFTQLPTVSFVIPDIQTDMHNDSIMRADTWLKHHFKDYIKWAKKNNSLFILTFDEGDEKISNRIVTIFCGAMVKGGLDTTQINHYSVLRTIETMYNLPYAGNANKAQTITSCWK